jgi:hypothetical protein
MISSSPRLFRSARLSAVLVAAVAAAVLTACAAPSAPSPGGTTPAPGATSASGECSGVRVVVDFGPLDTPTVTSCVDAGPALDVLDAAGIVTEGTADYGNQVVCRVNGRPSADETVTVDGADPFVETCDTLGSAAYWALWVITSPDGSWEYAQEGVATLQLAAGQSVGLVYTAGTDSTPPSD